MIVATSWWEITVPLIVALMTAGGEVLTWFANGVRAEHARLQKLYADAYSAVISYQEFPYVIRRRRVNTRPRGDQRRRTPADLGRVPRCPRGTRQLCRTDQHRIGCRVCEVHAFGPENARNCWHVHARGMAGAPLDNDAGMNISGIDYAALKTPQNDYLKAVKKNMTFWRVARPQLRD